MSRRELDAAYMARARELAAAGLGRVEPNPLVGCVIVKAGRIVGEGFHRRFGGPHAEIEALGAAGQAARGATVYVTLEPCCHHGKTGPCTDALIAARPARIVVACRDPFPAVAGRGIARLRRAGVKVEVGVGRAEAQELNAPFFKRIVTGLPYVTAKWAMTVDGAIATSASESKWISSAASRRQVHALRGRMDAIVIGIGTALADDPRLTARRVPRPRTARRVVIDPNLKLPDGSQLLATAGRAPLTIVAASDAPAARGRRLEQAGAQVLRLTRMRDGSLDLRAVLRHLSDVHQATHVLVEGGGRTLGRFFAAGLVDEAHVYIAPRILGDAGAIRPVVSSVPGLPVVLAQAQPLELRECRAVGPDVLLRYRASGRPKPRSSFRPA